MPVDGAQLVEQVGRYCGLGWQDRSSCESRLRAEQRALGQCGRGQSATELGVDQFVQPTGILAADVDADHGGVSVGQFVVGGVDVGEEGSLFAGRSEGVAAAPALDRDRNGGSEPDREVSLRSGSGITVWFSNLLSWARSNSLWPLSTTRCSIGCSLIWWCSTMRDG